MFFVFLDFDVVFEVCCWEIVEWVKMFYFGILFFFLEKWCVIWVIYVWCWCMDELMDSLEVQGCLVEELVEWFDCWEEKICVLFDGWVVDDLDVVMVDILECFFQGIQFYFDMIEGQWMDFIWICYFCFEDFKFYCYCVVGIVGLMIQGVMGVDQVYILVFWSDCFDIFDVVVVLGIVN